MLNKDLILAVDGGGTASRVALYSRAGQEVTKFEIGSLSAKSSGVGGVVWSLAGMMEAMAPYKERIACAVLGLSGLDSTSDVVTMTGMLAASGLMGPVGVDCKSVEAPYGWHVECAYGPNVLLCSDALLPLFATGAKEGSILIAGTGSIAMHVNLKGEIKRFGGWGYQVSDEGSGTWIGSEFVRKALHVADYLRTGRIQGKLAEKHRSLLHVAYKATCGAFTIDLQPYGVEQPAPLAQAEALCKWASEHTTTKDYSGLARTVLESDDEACRAICKRAASKLADLARCACVSPNQPLVLSGGLFANARFYSETAHAIAGKLPKKPPKIVRPTRDATYGGYELAKHAELMAYDALL